MLRPLRLAQGQNPLPQPHSQFSARLKGVFRPISQDSLSRSMLNKFYQFTRLSRGGLKKVHAKRAEGSDWQKWSGGHDSACPGQPNAQARLRCIKRYL
jgi:hypothetical protein